VIYWKIRKYQHIFNEIKIETCLDVNQYIQTKVNINSWLNDLESEEQIKKANFIFGAFIRQTFPSLFSNQVVGIQAMAQPIGLAYSLRVICSTSGDTNEK
jgi:hypothetical protein